MRPVSRLDHRPSTVDTSDAGIEQALATARDFIREHPELYKDPIARARLENTEGRGLGEQLGEIWEWLNKLGRVLVEEGRFESLIEITNCMEILGLMKNGEEFRTDRKTLVSHRFESPLSDSEIPIELAAVIAMRSRVYRTRGELDPSHEDDFIGSDVLLHASFRSKERSASDLGVVSTMTRRRFESLDFRARLGIRWRGGEMFSWARRQARKKRGGTSRFIDEPGQLTLVEGEYDPRGLSSRQRNPRLFGAIDYSEPSRIIEQLIAGRRLVLEAIFNELDCERQPDVVRLRPVLKPPLGRGL